MRADGSVLVINMENGNLVEIDPSNGNVISDTSYTAPPGVVITAGFSLALGPDDSIYGVLTDDTGDIMEQHPFFAKLNEVSGAWESIGTVPAFQATPSGYIYVLGMCFGPPFNDGVLYLASATITHAKNPNTYWACLL